MNLTDALNMVSPEQSFRVAFKAIDALQDFPPAEQVAGAAMFYHMIARRYDLSPARFRRVLEQCEYRTRDALAPNINRAPGDIARTVQLYINEEL